MQTAELRVKQRYKKRINVYLNGNWTWNPNAGLQNHIIYSVFRSVRLQEKKLLTMMLTARSINYNRLYYDTQFE